MLWLGLAILLTCILIGARVGGIGLGGVSGLGLLVFVFLLRMPPGSPPGTVLGQLSGTGHYVPYDDTASDGRENASAVLYADLDNGEGGAPASLEGVVIDLDAEVRVDGLVWGAGVNEAGALADLRTVGIKARD